MSSIRRRSTQAPRRVLRRCGWIAILLVGLLAMASCSTLGYYGQAIWGQTRILVHRRPIAKLVADPATPEELRAKLRVVARLREFAAAELGLPASGSFQAYVELPREPDGSRPRAVVWNVTAAPELSTRPHTWCFPVVGCVSYRGYFSRQRAERFAGRLRGKGFDVAVGGAAAYSTLGWFRDPVLSTVIDYPEIDLAALVFHELAHGLVYVAGDTRFNESFATAVEIEGVRRWLAATGEDPATMAAYRARMAREEQFAELVLAYRDRLQAAYDEDAAVARKRQRKRELFAELKEAYRELRSSWGGVPGLDAWFERDLNNADLAAVGAYHEYVPELERLLAGCRGDLECFYGVVRELAAASPEERARRLGSAAAEPAGSPAGGIFQH